MATFKKFEEIESWQVSRKLNKMIFDFTERAPMSRNFKLRDQILGSAGSAMDNIAEGFGRGNKAEFSNFLGISNGSAQEVQSQLYRSLDFGYISQEEFDAAYELADIVTRKNGKLIEYLNRSEIRGVRYKKTTEQRTTNDTQQTTNN